MKNSLWNLTSFGFATVLGLISIPIFIERLSLEYYGLFVLLNSILAPMGLLNLGFGQATIKFIAESYGKDDSTGANHFLRTTLSYNIFSGLLGTFIIILISKVLVIKVFNIPPTDSPMIISSLKWVAFTWTANQIVTSYMALPTALQKYNLVAIGSSLIFSGSILISILVLFFNGNILSLVQARFFWAIISIFIWVIIIRKLIPTSSVLPGWDKKAFSESFSFGVWQNLAALGGVLSSQADKLLLGIYMTPSQIGVYNTGWSVESTLNTLVYKIGEVLFPALSNLQGMKKIEMINKITLRSGWFLIILMILILGPFSVFSKDILTLYVGSDIANSAYQLVRILSIAGIISSGSISINQYMLGTGKTKWVALTSFTSGIVIFFSSLLLIPTYGLIGAGWGQIVAILLTRPFIQFGIWVKFLRNNYSAKVFFSYLYGPIISVLPLLISLYFLRDLFHGNLSFIFLILGNLTTALFFCANILLANRLFPGYSERKRDLYLIVNILYKGIAKKTNLPKTFT